MVPHGKKGERALLVILFLLEGNKPYGVSNIFELLPADVIEVLAFAGEFFVDLNRLFGHLLVGLFGAADELEILTGGNPFVTVGVQTDSQEHFPRGALASMLAIAHGLMVAGFMAQGQAWGGRGGQEVYGL
jgi:hypothetical protein